MSDEMPMMAAGTYVSNSMDIGGLGQQNTLTKRKMTKVGHHPLDLVMRQAQARVFNTNSSNEIDEDDEPVVKLKPGVPVMPRRIVQIVIADPNENVPLDKALLHNGGQFLTELTDQELFFDLDISGMLKAHNEKRVKLVDKKVKDRVEYLEPAKVRDLKMVVVTVATF